MDSYWALAVTILFSIGLLLLIVAGYGRYRGKIRKAQKCMSPPPNYEAAGFSYRLKSGVDVDTATSLIYDWAAQGYVSLVQHRDGGFTVRRRMSLDDSRPEYEKNIFRVLFESGNGENSVHSSRIALICKEISGLILRDVRARRRACRPRWRYYITPVLFGLSCATAAFCVLWLGAMRKVLLAPRFEFIDTSIASFERYTAALADVWPSMLVFSLQVLLLLVVLYKILVWVRPKWADMKSKTRTAAVLLALFSSLVLIGGIFLSCYGLYVDNDTDATLTAMCILVSCSGLLCVFAAIYSFCDTVGQPMEELRGFYRFLSTATPDEFAELFAQNSAAFSVCFAYAVSVGGGQEFLDRCASIPIKVPEWFLTDDGMKLSQERFLALLGAQVTYLKACYRLRRPPEDVVNHKNPMWRDTKTKF